MGYFFKSVFAEKEYRKCSDSGSVVKIQDPFNVVDAGRTRAAKGNNRQVTIVAKIG
ncbi:MAG: hypothetical protein WC856_05585 [Methylococcaceae bacterium]|jgi:hypothetical protein